MRETQFEMGWKESEALSGTMETTYCFSTKIGGLKDKWCTEVAIPEIYLALSVQSLNVQIQMTKLGGICLTSHLQAGWSGIRLEVQWEN